MKYIYICLLVFIFKDVQAQTHSLSLPAIFYDKEVRKLGDSSITLKVGTNYLANTRSISYHNKEKKKGNIDTLLCKYHDLLYLDIDDEHFDFDLLKCFKDSLKYLVAFSSFSKDIDFQLSNLEEIVGDMDMRLLGTLLSNSPKIVTYDVMGKGKIKHLEGIEFDSLRYIWLHSIENCFCRKDLRLPSGLLNAPNVEVLYIQHYCKRNYKVRRFKTLFADKFFAMPEIKSDSSKITVLEAECLDIADSYTLEQIKKLKKLKTLRISFTGADYSIFEDLKHIKEIRLSYPQGRKYYRRYRRYKIDTEELQKRYPNIKSY